MQLHVEREVLFSAVQQAIRAVDARVALPILSGLYLEVVGDRLVIAGASGELYVRVQIPVDLAAEEGRTVLPARFFFNLLRRLPSGPVEIAVEEERVRVRQGDVEFRLSPMDPEDFPPFPEEVGAVSISLAGERLERALRSVLFAASSSDTRPILKGVRWRAAGEELVFVATDSHRLARRVLPLEIPVDPPVEAIPPAARLEDILPLLDEADLWRLTFGKSTLVFRREGLEIALRLLEGVYPETDNLLTLEAQTTFLVAVEPFREALERAALVVQKSAQPTVRLDAEGGALVLSANHPELGSYREILPVEGFEGEKLSIWFNVRYLLEALKGWEEERAVLQFNGSWKPFLVRPELDPGWVHLIVPVKIP
ncbi:MAG: DNA polymerase III beta subunit [Brockia lithotrophica]|uniref:Beta sliding clamp n=1 Tax=Brockia lithotrophica TaxID=933949 RepID=A0A2T5GB35_9BACL|nr:DNA polymerase III subunit beta [Brockia lithotrophica]PTQ53400.1 MAG: DNA polymerase III beta subunit [Brockia lithotrophica]